MQELEKVLEEINRRIDEYVDHDYVRGSGDVVKGLSIAKSIVRKHMNDGWIPVEERLPEESLNSVIGWDEYRERCCFVQYYGGRWILGADREPVNIIAWRPLPEPYRPERCGGE